jgi:hypothetical protein
MNGVSVATVSDYMTADPVTVGPETGVKRITVTVSHNGKTGATLFGVRTEAWQEPPYE